MARGYLILPISFEDKTFGYVMMSYGAEARTYEEVCRHWLNEVTRGLEALRKECISGYLEKKWQKRAESKFSFMNEKKSMPILSEEEKEEMEAVEMLLDKNLLKYFFQPIVSAADGEIYSYEALMRSDCGKKIAPLKIIKYADLMGRLSDIEKATFVNVLELMDNKPETFGNRKVFINSIPGSVLEQDDLQRVESLLEKHSHTVVIEMTEQAELHDAELDSLKERFKKLGIDMAVDDYGTGYSNVTNLLRYMPQYVKIDRSLLSDIQNSTQKQHFVREIIDFCHNNGIQALAEGVETSEELGMVIRLGADLIQGYYVARPSEEIIQTVDDNVRMEISRFHQEKEEGTKDQTYVAGRTGRISLNALQKENKTVIVVGEKNARFRDIVIAGSPNTKTNIHIEVLEGYEGRITLENAFLSNKKKRPCIKMAENAKLTLRLEGDSYFEGSGIQVPESSRLFLEGDGNLKMVLSGAESYAIGNSANKRHGLLAFYQDGEIFVESNGQTTIGIGSGRGGKIEINKGKYVIHMIGDEGVGIGSLDGKDPIVIHDVDLMMDISLFYGVGIGSQKNSTEIQMWHSMFRYSGSGKTYAVLGTLEGKEASISLRDMAVHLSVRADKSIAVGSFTGKTVCRLSTTGFRYKGIGMESLVFGGFTDHVEIEMENSDYSIDITTETGRITNAKPENFKKNYTLSTVILNGKDVE